MNQQTESLTTKHIRVHGIVQGVGFRPFVSRTATWLGVTGTVANRGSYVEIYVRGSEAQHRDFLHTLEHEAPPRAVVLKVEVKDCEDRPFSDFSIIQSRKEPGDIFVSPDIATCPKCRQELFDPTNRRYLHPFINCTSCGPRVTILDAMPYDRERTSMREFPMCPACEEEYWHPGNRRFDAQPVCCNDCGPEVYLLGRKERGRDAITAARQAICAGQIIAVKGIGGFHLCCDATNEETVERLRQVKTRPVKPFAVMARDMDVVRRECETEPFMDEILTGHQKPILLLRKKEGGNICPSVAPGNPKVGVMLPYAPIQLLLFTYDDDVTMPDVLVMTSGNVSGAPICRNDEEAVEELGTLCDCILTHNRKILTRADDSVMDTYKGAPYMIRRSRGYAPLPFLLSQDWQGQVLAIGGELKNTFCVGVNNLFYPSAYVGDLEDLRTVEALTETVERMNTLLEVTPTVAACDLHPRYQSVRVAEEMGLPVIKVQHHYAHILSCLAENDCAQKVIGVSFDGTGYGSDGTIWGGEILAADYDGFNRIGSVEPFLQIGGDVSAKEGWRIAVSVLYGRWQDEEKTKDAAERCGLCTRQEAGVQIALAKRQMNSVISTSAGRLFDAVSAILGICRASTYEGDASTRLEYAAEAFEESGGEPLSVQMDLLTEDLDGRMILNTGELVETIAERRLAGEEAGRLAYFFHEKLAEMVIAACLRAREETGLDLAALSGGVYQNQLFLRLTDEGLGKEGFTVLRHSLIPPGDGGIAIGQAVYAMNQINQERTGQEQIVQESDSAGREEES